ncbi:PiggyBac transposable element-derived protein 3 [Trichinella pseudospiralis]|uniref:PiggyBac transposable element-derived protein 3 n=1 Tax=Trichinella pseudospiralis TaxID=6337 RepID=A0A0V1DVN0_TRIPS|nr:PiggyBac transposable element-derived protein 3 [Trichinella pseudospiralis]
MCKSQNIQALAVECNCFFVRLRSSRNETLKKDEAEASTSHDASASSSMDISDSREGRRCEQISTLQEAKEVMATSNQVLKFVVLPPTAGDSGGDDTDQQYLPDDPEDEFDPAGKLKVEQEVKVEEFETAKLSRKEKRALLRWKKTENLHRIFPVEQIQRNENFQKNCFYDTVRKCNNKAFTVSPQEIRQFIGVILLSGYNCQPEAKHYYWSTQPDMDAQGAISCISSSRFMEIKKYLYLADNQKLVKDDKMSKLCTNCSTPALSSMLSVDESIVPYYGRHAAKLFLKGKSIRFGYKVWLLCGNDGKEIHALKVPLSTRVIRTMVDIIQETSNITYDLLVMLSELKMRYDHTAAMVLIQ